jgi:hypothetical protein
MINHKRLNQLYIMKQIHIKTCSVGGVRRRRTTHNTTHATRLRVKISYGNYKNQASFNPHLPHLEELDFGSPETALSPKIYSPK